MAEQLLFSDPDRYIFISNQRIIIDGRKFNTSIIHSASLSERNNDVSFGYEVVVFWTIMAVVCLLFLDQYIYSIPISVLSIIIAINSAIVINKKVYVLVLNTLSGEKEVLSLHNQIAIERMVRAINRAVQYH
ncbi:DUF6232 family protein [Anaerobacillus sp. MEB173]|uniref:DUF6232 family protein n=1 Tax=Anaerobacillus sp. MEB173 TaxID=3383345 RepID=UPI003F902F51